MGSLDPVPPDAAIALCRSSHVRLLRTVAAMTDEQVGEPSRLAGWTRGHLVTHLARNADSFTIRMEGALRGEDVPRYPGGVPQRNADIESGAGRSAAELAADLEQAQDRLEDAWRRSAAAGWPMADVVESEPTTGSPLRRLGEVEVHHVDLGLGYEMGDWPEEYVAWQLDALLATVPRRVRPEDRRAVVAWLAGRAPGPLAVELDPW